MKQACDPAVHTKYTVNPENFIVVVEGKKRKLKI